ncbi:malto-oligosyltrehalose trehalohydrolase [Paracoccus thiocyanatus]|uniref:Malto-oligosyltrehalose trehalohydrolase n=1 Tax=Paracoccus thiocyanatus TaxID=34006 RepID=A0A3D8P9F4_9RHOB|nr:malto-oligosyltrehalose trehalohydrolase [Paracoccus thiocyanatus]RDW12262.1 malto-oligosyltrehalose trehalohydrolase [Paracoccus thiocyanatus]
MARWGACWDDAGRWQARLWAPGADRVQLVLNGREQNMARDGDGYWSATAHPGIGDTYLFRVDGRLVPDPASRCQVRGVHGASVVTAAADFPWQVPWRGRDWAEAAIYELHVGSFTPSGTLAEAETRLAGLAALGFTAIELMPLGQWPGRRGWGYDGVLPFALHPAYGAPDDLRRFVDRAHGLGLMVLLDLVMNHFGPDGASLHLTSPEFFDPGRQTPWGAAIDFSQPAVRAYWTECAEYWLAEFRLDGLRLDAVHQIAGPGARQFLADLALRARGAGAGRAIHLITEDERNLPDLRQSGYDASWNDDFHHAIHTLLTGEDQGYYASFARDPMGDLALALARGHVEQGQPRPGRDRPRGAPCEHLPPTAFVNAIQTHDQVGNRAQGERLLALADPAGVRMAYALLLVAPYIPMVFMGEERGAQSPFLFFADYRGDLAQAVRQGRAAEFADDPSFGGAVPDPLDPATLERSRIDWQDQDRARPWLDLTRRALDFRRESVVGLLKSGRMGAEVQRHGRRGLDARWRFGAGTLRIVLSAGAVEDLPAIAAPQFRLGRPGMDPFALCASVEPS